MKKQPMKAEEAIKLFQGRIDYTITEKDIDVDKYKQELIEKNLKSLSESINPSKERTQEEYDRIFDAEYWHKLYHQFAGKAMESLIPLYTQNNEHPDYENARRVANMSANYAYSLINELRNRKV